MRDLGAMGLETLMLTGDSAASASDVARVLNLTENQVRAGLLPTDKEEVVRSLRREGMCVAMVANVRRTQYPGEGEVFQVQGDKPERWVRQTDFSNNEAVGYLADRLATAGVEDELVKAGARAGDTVLIGPVEGGVLFTWEPTVSTGAEMLGARGTDMRVEDYRRRTNTERRRQYHESMDAKEAARQELRDEAAEGLWTDASSWDGED